MNVAASIVAAAAVALSATAAAADVYKCVVDGRTTYQDGPCRGAGSVMIVGRPPAPAPPGRGAAAGAASLAELRAQVAAMEAERRGRDVAFEADRLEREIQSLEKSRAAELAALRDKAAFAYHNQHGAIWERGWARQAIVADVQAVNDKYDGLIRAVRERLAQLGRGAAGAPAPGEVTKAPQ